MNIDEKYKKAGEIISTAGGTPIPVNDTLIKLLKYFIMEDELDFITAFHDKKSQTMEQLKLSSGLSEEEINKKVKDLAGRGVIFNQPNSKGLMVFRLLPLINVGPLNILLWARLRRTTETGKYPCYSINCSGNLKIWSSRIMTPYPSFIEFTAGRQNSACF